MSRIISISLIVGALTCAVFALSSYRSEQPGARLFAEYFSAAPNQGYAVQRALTAGANSTDTSIIRQAYAYHKSADYDLALMSFRAYLESTPLPENDEPLLLAATSAVATGHYEEGAEYLELIEAHSPYGAEASWHRALINLRRGELAGARTELKKVAGSSQGRNFPTVQLLGKIPSR